MLGQPPHRPGTSPGERGEDGPAGRPVLLLGGSGFLGRHIRAAFAAAGFPVLSVHRQARETQGGRRDVHLDLVAAQPGELARLCAGADVVVNASGVVWGGTERQMSAVNAELVGRLTEAIAGLPTRPRLIQLGSAYEYGPGIPGTSVGEDAPPAPTTVYGRTKLRGSQAVLRAARERAVEGMVLRISVACGPGAPRGSLPGIVAQHLAAGHRELRLAPLRAHRDLVDVRDVADAVVAAARRPAGAVTGRVFNIGRGEALPVRGLVDLMISLSGRRLSIVEEAAAQHTRSDSPWQRLDITRARRVLGWSPCRALEESVRDLLAAAGVPSAPRFADTTEAKEGRT